MVEAATSVFAKRGYAAATMKEIAAEAGCTAPSFYNYFTGKEQLFEALLARTFEEIIATLIDEPPVPKGFGGRLDALMRRQFALVDRRRDTFRVLLSAQVAPPEVPAAPDGIRRQPAAYQRLMGLLAAWFADAAGGKRVGRLSPEDAAMVYLALAQAFQFQWMTEHPSGCFVDQVKLVREVFLHGMGRVAGPGAKSRSSAAKTTKTSSGRRTGFTDRRTG